MAYTIGCIPSDCSLLSFGDKNLVLNMQLKSQPQKMTHGWCKSIIVILFFLSDWSRNGHVIQFWPLRHETFVGHFWEIFFFWKNKYLSGESSPLLPFFNFVLIPLPYWCWKNLLSCHLITLRENFASTMGMAKEPQSFMTSLSYEPTLGPKVSY